MLPASYVSPQHLPFNRTCLGRRFQLAAPDQDPGDAGSWLAVRGNDLLVAGPPERPDLPAGELDAAEGLYLGTWDGRPCRDEVAGIVIPRQQVT